jgi:hypothetical protein
MGGGSPRQLSAIASVQDQWNVEGAAGAAGSSGSKQPITMLRVGGMALNRRVSGAMANVLCIFDEQELVNTPPTAAYTIQSKEDSKHTFFVLIRSERRALPLKIAVRGARRWIGRPWPR